MKKFWTVAAFASLFVAGISMTGCQEGVMKVFQCEDAYPYFSKITHKCYATQADLDKAEDQFSKTNPEQAAANAAEVDE